MSVTPRHLLIPGITGRVNIRDRRPVNAPRPDLRAFRSSCHEFARHSDGRVLSVDHPSEPRSFHAADIELPYGARILILLHVLHPFVAAASEASGFCVAFDDSEAIRPFFEPTFRVIPRGILEERFNAEASKSSRLGPVEWEDIRYWKPDRIGDLIFNWYD